MNSKTNKSQINLLYNRDITPEDSQKTSFFYHKVLALQFILAAFCGLSIFASLANYFFQNKILLKNHTKDIILILTFLIIVTRYLQKLSRVKWLQQKKDIEQSSTSQYISMIIDLIFLIPCPNRIIDGNVKITTYLLEQAYIPIDDVLTVYMLLRFKYIFQFLIHSQLYYGSRPDRLSRLYAVKFGTYNAIKFLINQKPHLFLISISLINYTIFPIAILLIEGKINSNLNHYLACLHYVMVTQATVGYGNINVISIYGRIICIMCLIVGVLNSSLVLILFMRTMQQNAQQQQSYFLLSSLEKKFILTKARVQRIQNEWCHKKSHFTPQQAIKQEEKLNKFRFNNRRQIMLERQQPMNLKKMMLSNFSEVIEQLSELREKQQILSKYIKVIQKSEGRKEQPQILIKNKRQNILLKAMDDRVTSH